MKTLMKTKNIFFALTLLASIFITGRSEAQVQRDVSNYNLQNNVGLKGYDPVSYFSEGGSLALTGLENLSFDYFGVTYKFANEKNLALFKLDPKKFEPSYGGWCAYAMASGAKVDINPLLYTIHGRRLHFFVSKRAKQNFDSDVEGHEVKADTFWKQISGENPRL